MCAFTVARGTPEGGPRWHPPTIFVGETALKGRDIRDTLTRHQAEASEWFVRGGRAITVHDLREPPWDDICDQGTVEVPRGGRVWAVSDDPVRQAELAELPPDLREQARADSVFDTTAANSVKETVTLFEVFTRNQLTSRVAEHEGIVKAKGRGVFQRLDDIDELFAEHLGAAISVTVRKGVWARLRIVFQQRHVLVHRPGIGDEQYVNAVPQADQQVRQRLVLNRSDAEQALDALEAIVCAVSAGPTPPR